MRRPSIGRRAGSHADTPSLRSIVVVVAFTALPALAACLLTTDLDSLSEPDATVILSSSSSGASGTSSGSDGAVDAGADVATDRVVPISDGGPFCVGHPDATFCTEFSTPLPQEWATTEKTTRGEISATDESPRSPPLALRATIAPGPVATERAYLTRSFSPKIYSYVRWSFDVRIGGIGAPEAEIGSLAFDTNGVGYGYIVVLRRDRSLHFLAQTDANGSEEYFGPFGTLAASTWQRLTVELELSTTAPSRVSLYLEGAKVMNQQVVDKGLKPASFILAQGVLYQRRVMPDVETRVEFDNVLIEAH